MPPQELTAVRVLLTADTHLGFDLPFRPRIKRRRRGHDFLANFERALQPVLAGEADLVVHGGDLFYRSKVPAPLVEMAIAPLIRVAERGVPVFLVPGNHERSRIPLHLWARHPSVHIFDEPKTYICRVGELSVALAGFPFSKAARDHFSQLVCRAGQDGLEADVRLLCVHQIVEGAQVGSVNYTFRRGPDVVPGRDVPGGFAAVLAGHVHRSQMLTRDLRGRPLAAPVIYPGSVERTSFAERDEEKHHVLLRVEPDCRCGGRLADVSFIRLPARPMVDLVVVLDGLKGESLTKHLQARFASLDPEAVVRVQVRGSVSPAVRAALSAPSLRAIAPSTMNVSLAHDTWRRP